MNAQRLLTLKYKDAKILQHVEIELHLNCTHCPVWVAVSPWADPAEMDAAAEAMTLHLKQQHNVDLDAEARHDRDH